MGKMKGAFGAAVDKIRALSRRLVGKKSAGATKGSSNTPATIKKGRMVIEVKSGGHLITMGDKPAGYLGGNTCVHCIKLPATYGEVLYALRQDAPNEAIYVHYSCAVGNVDFTSLSRVLSEDDWEEMAAAYWRACKRLPRKAAKLEVFLLTADEMCCANGSIMLGAAPEESLASEASSSVSSVCALDDGLLVPSNSVSSREGTITDNFLEGQKAGQEVAAKYAQICALAAYEAEVETAVVDLGSTDIDIDCATTVATTEESVEILGSEPSSSHSNIEDDVIAPEAPFPSGTDMREAWDAGFLAGCMHAEAVAERLARQDMSETASVVDSDDSDAYEWLTSEEWMIKPRVSEDRHNMEDSREEESSDEAEQTTPSRGAAPSKEEESSPRHSLALAAPCSLLQETETASEDVALTTTQNKTGFKRYRASTSTALLENSQDGVVAGADARDNPCNLFPRALHDGLKDTPIPAVFNNNTRQAKRHRCASRNSLQDFETAPVFIEHNDQPAIPAPAHLDLQTDVITHHRKLGNHLHTVDPIDFIGAFDQCVEQPVSAPAPPAAPAAVAASSLPWGVGVPGHYQACARTCDEPSLAACLPDNLFGSDEAASVAPMDSFVPLEAPLGIIGRDLDPVVPAPLRVLPQGGQLGAPLAAAAPLVNHQEHIEVFNNRVVDPQLPDCQKVRKEDLLLEGSLGKGGFGAVNKYKNDIIEHMPAYVAVEELHTPEDRNKKDLMEGLLYEINLHKDLSHPNIVSFLGAMTGPKSSLGLETTGLVMECGVASLEQYLDSLHYTTDDEGVDCLSYRRMSLLELAQLALGAVQAVAYLHAKGVIHYDIKPDNLLLFTSPNGPVLKLADFGISQKKTLNGRVGRCGTAYYMAPELALAPAEGIGMQESADVWSLGMVFWQMFTLKTPHHDIRLEDIIILRKEGRYGLKLPLTCEREWMVLIRECVQFDEAARPTCAQIIASLQNIIDSELHDVEE